MLGHKGRYTDAYWLVTRACFKMVSRMFNVEDAISAIFADDSGLFDGEPSGEEGKDVYPLGELILPWSTVEELTRAVEYGRRNN